VARKHIVSYAGNSCGELWSRTDAVRRLTETLDTAASALPYLTTATVCGDADGQEFLTRAKFLCETALVLYAATRVAESSPSVRVRARHLASELAPLARDEWTLTWMRLRPSFAGELSVAHLCLNAIGLPSSSFDRELKALTVASAIGLADRTAWKDVEALWHHKIGGPEVDLDWRVTLRRTALCQRQDAIFSSRKDVYAFTHALIYATDFGHEEPLLEDRNSMVEDAESSLARCLDDDDFDLGAEVLLTWPYLRWAWSPTAAFALLTMTGVNDTVGILPSMSLRHEDFIARDTSSARAKYFYAEGYHTAYIMGLLAAAILLPGAPPPANLAVEFDRNAASIADKLRSLLIPASQTPQWEELFLELPASRRAALIPMLADIGVRRAVKAADFRQLRDILRLFLTANVPPPIGVVQGADLLRRVSRGSESAIERTSFAAANDC
jgi:hypothetical protein